MSADDQAAISEASSYGKVARRGVGQLFLAESSRRRSRQDVETDFGQNCAFECEKSNAVLSWGRPWAALGGPGRTAELLPARGAAGPGVLLLGAARCVHRLLNGSINA